MAKKARFYKLSCKTAYENFDMFIPAPNSDAADSFIRSETVNVINVKHLGWYDIWIAPGQYSSNPDSPCNDLAIFGVNIDGYEYTYTSNDNCWGYLNAQFQNRVSIFINEFYDDNDY